VRYRARPSFTVEVKRNNKRLPLTVTTGDSAPRERYRRADQLLFGGSSPTVNSAARLDDGGLSTRTTDSARQPPAAEAVRSEPQAEAAVAQRLTGRILPDLFGETRADARLRQEEEERAARLRAQRGARKTSLSLEPTRADTQTGDEPDAGRTTDLASIPAAEPLSLEEPVLATVEGVALAVWSRALMVHSSHWNGRRRYGPSSPWERPHDGVSASSDTA
jgi:hypothetical protein